MHNIRTNGTKLGFTSLCEIWDNADANRGRWGVGFHICIRPANDPPTHPHPTPTYPIPPPPPPCPTAGTPWRPLCTVCTGNARQTNAARASSALGKLDALCALHCGATFPGPTMQCRAQRHDGRCFRRYRPPQLVADAPSRQLQRGSKVNVHLPWPRPRPRKTPTHCFCFPPDLFVVCQKSLFG